MGSSRCSASFLAPHFECLKTALQLLNFLLQHLQPRFVLHHLSQYTFYVGLRFGRHGFRGTIVGPRRLCLCELDSAFGLRSERADFVSQGLKSFRVLSLEVGKSARIHVVCLVDPGIVSLSSTGHPAEELTLCNGPAFCSSFQSQTSSTRDPTPSLRSQCHGI